MFLAKHSPLIGYHGNNEWPIIKLLILNMTYIMVLKVTKFCEDRLNRFWYI